MIRTLIDSCPTLVPNSATNGELLGVVARISGVSSQSAAAGVVNSSWLGLLDRRIRSPKCDQNRLPTVVFGAQRTMGENNLKETWLEATGYDGIDIPLM